VCISASRFLLKNDEKTQKKNAPIISNPMFRLMWWFLMIPSSDSWGPTQAQSHPGPSLLLTQIAVRRDGFIELLQALMI